MRRLGTLEAAVMEQLWLHQDGVLARQLVSELPHGRALTTVLTVLTRLQRKGLVERRKLDGSFHLYFATESKAEFTASLMVDALNDSGDADASLQHFINSVSDSEAQALRDYLKSRRRNSRRQ